MERLAELQEHLAKNKSIKQVWIKGEDWVFNEPKTKTKEAEGVGDKRVPAEYKTTDGWVEKSRKEILSEKVVVKKETGPDAGAGDGAGPDNPAKKGK